MSHRPQTIANITEAPTNAKAQADAVVEQVLKSKAPNTLLDISENPVGAEERTERRLRSAPSQEIQDAMKRNPPTADITKSEPPSENEEEVTQDQLIPETTEGNVLSEVVNQVASLRSELAARNVEIERLKNVIEVTKDTSFDPESLAVLVNAELLNPDAMKSDEVVIVPRETRDCSIGHREVGKDGNGKPIMVPNVYHLIKDRPQRVPRNVFQVLKEAKLLRGI